MANTLNPYTTVDPYGKSEECAQFTIDDLTKSFLLDNIMIAGREYTFSLWIKSDADGSIIVNRKTYQTNTEWAYHTITFTATQSDLFITFGATGTYYIFHPQLETGNKATDWTPAVEDMATGEDVDNVESNLDGTNERLDELDEKFKEASLTIDGIKGMISSLVVNEKGETLMQQDGDKWVFNIGDVNKSLTETESQLSELKNLADTLDKDTTDLHNELDKLADISGWVTISTYDEQPCLMLGKKDSQYGLIITNSKIIFIDKSSDATYVDNDELFAEKLSVGTELRQNGFVWTKRSNGNFGLSWKGDVVNGGTE